MIRTVAIVLLLSASVVHAGEYRVERGEVYADPGGKKLHMTMYIPKDDGTGLRPGIVVTHGGAWMLGTRYQQRWYCHQFARHGYVVMTIEYRLMPKYPFPNCLYDSKAAVRWMRLNANRYRIDPERIAAFGASAGGHLSALLAATTPEDGFEGECNPGASSEVRAAISLYGAVDLTMYRDKPMLGPLGWVAKRFMKAFTSPKSVGTKEGALKAASPITYARPSTKPILFVHGTKDHLVHYEQSVRFYERLKALNVPTRLISVKNRDHAFDFVYWKQRREIFEDMLTFYEEQGCGPQLKGKQEPSQTP